MIFNRMEAVIQLFGIDRGQRSWNISKHASWLKRQARELKIMYEVKG
jgi:hypothetical protein